MFYSEKIMNILLGKKAFEYSRIIDIDEVQWTDNMLVDVFDIIYGFDDRSRNDEEFLSMLNTRDDLTKAIVCRIALDEDAYTKFEKKFIYNDAIEKVAMDRVGLFKLNGLLTLRYLIVLQSRKVLGQWKIAYLDDRYRMVSNNPQKKIFRDVSDAVYYGLCGHDYALTHLDNVKIVERLENKLF